MSTLETLGYDTWDNALIRESVKRDINLVIVEELGVSAQVTSVINHLVEKIKEGYVTIKSTPLRDQEGKYINGVGFRDFTFTDKVFGTDMTFFIRVYLFNDEQTYQKMVTKFGVKPFTDAKSSFGDNKLPSSGRIVKTNLVSVSAVCVNGHLSEDTLSASLSHELRHMYDQSMWQKSFTTRKDNDLYRNSMGIINSANYNEKQRMIAFAIYQSFDYEQQALIQEFYGGAITTLNTKGPNAVNDYIKDNEILDTLMKMRFIRDQLSENGNTIDEFHKIEGLIGLDISSTIKIITNGIDSLAKKYGKAIISVKNEMEREGINISQLERTNEINSRYKI